MAVFHLDQKAAACTFGMGVTALKTALRKSFGIKRWPSRKFAPLRRVLRYYDAVGPAEDAAWLQELEQQMMLNPNIPLRVKGQTRRERRYAQLELEQQLMLKPNMRLPVKGKGRHVQLYRVFCARSACLRTIAMEAATASPHAASDVLKLKYFDLSGFGGLSGRGGSVRFFLLANGIPFTEEVVDWAGWGAGLKQKAMASGESPTGHLPLVYLPGSSSSSPPLLETFAILRRLAKRDGQYGTDEERDYAADVAADATVEFRSALLDSAFGGPDGKLAYTSSPDKRPYFYKVMEALLQRFGSSSSHTVGSSASFADAVVFAVLWDDVAVHGHDEALWGSNPGLAGFFRAYAAQPAVLGWCKGARPDLLTK
ncbi:hypothetical protein OEZ86_004483 [Tetradesmus obliquus]|nr:hypothetical protein OEZ86_004483 [Tetradesmus obliquus]